MPPTRSSDSSRPFKIYADPARKLLRAEFRQIVKPSDMPSELEQLRTMLNSLGNGFTLVTDLTELDQMDIECVTYVTRLMDLCLSAGVSKVVRIIPDPSKDIGFGLLSLTHYRGKVPIATYESRAEAEKSMPALA